MHTAWKAHIGCTQRKQSVVARSTCKTEYLATSGVVKQTVRIRKLFSDCFIPQQRTNSLHIDNTAAIKVAKCTVPTKRRKLNDIRYHLLHDRIWKNITVAHVPLVATFSTYPQSGKSETQQHPNNATHYPTVNLCCRYLSYSKRAIVAPENVQQRPTRILVPTRD